MASGLPRIGLKTKAKSATGHRRAHSLEEEQFPNPFRLTEDSLDDAPIDKTTTKLDKQAMSRSERLKTLMGDDYTQTVLNATVGATTTLNIIPPRRQEKEDMTDFIAKKREMFLVQMSLDTKREEIQKLEEKAQKQEKALLASEEKLKKDADEFELFLKKNDSNAQEAIKKAEEETARKQKKTQEIKLLTGQIQALSSEMSKQKDMLKTCKEYKEFLDMLTPPEWFERFAKERMDLRERLRKESFTARHKEWELLRRRLVEQHRRETEARKESRRDRSRRTTEPDEDEEENRLVIPPAPRIEDEPLPEIPEEEPPMYFKDPAQLMEIFSALEEQNLFLIQNSQETELTLEELRHKFMQTTEDMNGRTQLLDDQIRELRSQIDAEVTFAHSLKARRQADVSSSTGTAVANASGAQSEHEKEVMLQQLKAKVTTVFQTCGKGDGSSSTLIMLSQLESELESLLSAIDRMPADYVKNQEKEKEKGRREKKRIEQQLLQERQQEERNRRAIERSLQAPKKRTGKPIMFRSRLIRQEVNTANKDDDNKDNDDEIRHLT